MKKTIMENWRKFLKEGDPHLVDEKWPNLDWTTAEEAGYVADHLYGEDQCTSWECKDVQLAITKSIICWRIMPGHNPPPRRQTHAGDMHAGEGTYETRDTLESFTIPDSGGFKMSKSTTACTFYNPNSNSRWFIQPKYLTHRDERWMIDWSSTIIKPGAPDDPAEAPGEWRQYKQNGPWYREEG